MIIVGLTGGIGSGKSTVAQMFRDLGVPVYDSDAEAKQLMVNSTELKHAIIALLGEDAYTDGTLNRSYIAEKVFTDPGLLEKLNALVHPAVRTDFTQWAAQQKAPYVIQETALIFENGIQDFYDRILLVTAPLELRIKRVMDRDNVTEKQILERMEHQLTDDKKESQAHFCIQNIDFKTTRETVEELHQKLLHLVY